MIDSGGTQLDDSTSHSVLIGSFVGKDVSQVRATFVSSGTGAAFLADFTALGAPIRFATSDVANLPAFYSGAAGELVTAGNSLIGEDLYTVIVSGEQFLVVNHGIQFEADEGSSELEQFRADAFLDSRLNLDLIVGTFGLANTVVNSQLYDAYQLEEIGDPITPEPPEIEILPLYEAPAGEIVEIDATPVFGHPTDFSYQWFIGTFPIPAGFGGQEAVFAIEAIAENEGTWAVEVTNDAGFARAEFVFQIEVDTDGDGLSDTEETDVFGSDPGNPDTDGDGINDGDEVNLYATDPTNADSDGDGLLDGNEISVTGTDPNEGDTDGDGLSDYDEVVIHGSDPNLIDSDGDGLTDQAEVVVWQTDPNGGDTDSDGLGDYDEVTVHGTDPNDPDTDGDSLGDGEEVATHGTDPTDADSDGDGVADGTEVRGNPYGFDPLQDSSSVLADLQGFAGELEGVFTRDQLVDVDVSGAVVEVDEQGTLVFHLGLQESSDLTTWQDFYVTPEAVTTVDGEIRIEGGGIPQPIRFYRFFARPPAAQTTPADPTPGM